MNDALLDKDAILDDLHARFAALKNAFVQWDTEIDVHIQRWRYAEQTVFELRADYFRRFNERIGRLVDDEPSEAHMFYAYGYDDQDRICYAAFFQVGDAPRSVTFYNYAENQIDLAEFFVIHHTDQYYLGAVARRVLLNGQPVYYAEFGQDGLVFETYHYDELRRLTRVVTDYDQHFGEDTYEYDGDVLQRIVTRMAPTLAEIASVPEVISYELPPVDETDNALYDAARRALYDAVTTELKQLDLEAHRQAPVCFLVLSHDAVADDGMTLMIGDADQRAVWEAETDDHRFRSLIDHYHPRDLILTTIYPLPQVFARWLRTYRRDRRWGEIRQLVCQVARDLNDQDWRGLLNTTGDFIVYASDYEALDDPHDEIRACVPEEKLRLLIDQGLLD